MSTETKTISISERKDAMFTLSSAIQIYALNAGNNKERMENIYTIVDTIVESIRSEYGMSTLPEVKEITHPATTKTIEAEKQVEVQEIITETVTEVKNELVSTELTVSASDTQVEPEESNTQQEDVIPVTTDIIPEVENVRMATGADAYKALVNEVSKLIVVNRNTIKSVDTMPIAIRDGFYKFIMGTYPEKHDNTKERNRKQIARTLHQAVQEVITALKREEAKATDIVNNQEALNKSLETVDAMKKAVEEKKNNINLTAQDIQEFAGKAIGGQVKAEETPVIETVPETIPEEIPEVEPVTVEPTPEVIPEATPEVKPNTPEELMQIIATTQEKDTLKEAVIGVRKSLGKDATNEVKLKMFHDIEAIMHTRLSKESDTKIVRNYLQSKKQVETIIKQLAQKAMEQLAAEAKAV
jgi:S-ribosylhomocysteine lyase LuxS involved in autoinducer biosynthesis